MTPANNPVRFCTRRRTSTLETKHQVIWACFLFAFCIAAPIRLSAQSFKTLVAFDIANGAEPNALVISRGGELYGTTQYGGSNGSGTVFKVTRAGALRTIYDFCQLPNCADGQSPNTGLTFGRDGNLYGVTSGGGSTDDGTFFKISREGKLTTLYNFCSLPNCADGGGPRAGLTLARNGTFYGITFVGGAQGLGTIFNITTSGILTTVYSFCPSSPCLIGQEVGRPLTVVNDGNLYGTATIGGAYGCGTVFQLTPEGQLRTVHTFDYSDGCNPVGGLLQASDGNLYGTTTGITIGNGTIFSISKGNKFKTLYRFNFSIGANPMGTLIQGKNGSLFGTTYSGGRYGSGTVFEFSPAGVLTTLHDFPYSEIGSQVFDGLVQNCKGDLYGTTFSGGDLKCDVGQGCGTVIRLAP